MDLGLLNILIIPDKFKGTLAAKSVAEAIARGWRQARPHDALVLVPMSDGGDGFGQVMGELHGAERREVVAENAAHRPCTATWWWAAQSKTALIDSAGVIGLAMLPPGKFHPFDLDTRGLGLVIQAAVESGAEQCLLGIGGSATNDAGFGMAAALGWRFIDEHGVMLHRWTNLKRLHHVEPPRNHNLFTRCSVAVDVQNVLLGPHGASRIYGPQKGLTQGDFPLAERSLQTLATVMAQYSGVDYASVPGAGAAGGLGFGCLAFLGAQLEPGFELFATHARLEAHLKATNFVITGEGAIDQSTLMGKGVGRIGQRCKELGIPCLALGGQVNLGEGNSLFTQTSALTDLTTLDEAKGRTEFWLQELARQAAKGITRA